VEQSRSFRARAGFAWEGDLMPSYAQLTACNPHAFIEAGQTYQRMAQGFGRVRAAFQKGMAVLDANWQGAAKEIMTGRGQHLDGGIMAGGQEADSTGQVLVTLGQALTTAQTSLRAAVATAHGVGLIVTPSGDVFNPNPVYNQAGNAMLGPVRAMIMAAVAAATAADAAAAGKIGTLAAGKLIATFGSQGGKGATIVQEVAAVATGQTKVDSPTTAATLAARVANQADFGHLGPVERTVIDQVTAPTGIIGSEGLAAWTARRKGATKSPDPTD
jgi:hypothetical protein